MKKIISLALALCLILSLAVSASAAEERRESAEITYRDIRLLLDGREIIPCDEQGNTVEAFILRDTTYLPLRAVAQALGLGVKWIPETGTVELSLGGEVRTGSGLRGGREGSVTAELCYRGISVTLDGEALKLKNAKGEAVEPFILEGSTYLPLRVIGEALGLEVDWDGASDTVLLGELPEEGLWLGSFSEQRVSLDGEHDSSLGVRCFYDELGRITEQYSVFSGSREGYERMLWFYDDAGEVYRHVIIDRYEAFADIVVDIERGGEVYYRTVSTCYPAPGDGSERDSFEGIPYEYRDTEDYDESMERIGYYCEYADGSYDLEKRVYDENGLLITRITEYSGGFKCVCSYSYDSEGRLILESYDEQGYLWSVSYSYDAAGNLIGHVTDYDDHSSDSAYTYDARGLVITESYRLRDEKGNVTSGWDASFEYDADGNRLLERSVDMKGFAMEYRYEYDGEGRLLKESYSDDDGSWHNTVIVYDGEGRVLSERMETDSGYWHSQEYVYDEFGNTVLDHHEAFGDEIVSSEYSYCDRGCCLLSRLTTDNVGSTRETNTIDKFHNVIRTVIVENAEGGEYRLEMDCEYVCVPAGK